MTITRSLLLFALVTISVACGFLLGQQNGFSVAAQRKPVSTAKNSELIGRIKAEKIKMIKVLSDEDDRRVYAVISQTGEPPIKDSILKTSDRLNIYDESGRSLYELREFVISDVQSRRFKPDSRQLLIETNGGGTDDFLTILDWNDMTFKELVASRETQLQGGFWTMPQYRTGNRTPYFHPEQLVVIQQIGGADDAPEAVVFRFQNNKFQKVGRFSMKDLGDLIERQIIEKPSN